MQKTFKELTFSSTYTPLVFCSLYGTHRDRQLKERGMVRMKHLVVDSVVCTLYCSGRPAAAQLPECHYVYSLAISTYI